MRYDKLDRCYLASVMRALILIYLAEGHLGKYGFPNWMFLAPFCMLCIEKWLPMAYAIP